MLELSFSQSLSGCTSTSIRYDQGRVRTCVKGAATITTRLKTCINSNGEVWFVSTVVYHCYQDWPLSCSSYDSDSGHTPHQPLTLSSQGMSHDYVSMATGTSTGSVTDEPDTAPAALLAAMATRPHPLKQQLDQPTTSAGNSSSLSYEYCYVVISTCDVSVWLKLLSDST